MNNRVDTTKSEIKIDKISLTNYKFFSDTFELPLNGKDLLMFGENGSGKSSLYKAIELLTKQKVIHFSKNRNIFNPEKQASVNFLFQLSKNLPFMKIPKTSQNI